MITEDDVREQGRLAKEIEKQKRDIQKLEDGKRNSAEKSNELKNDWLPVLKTHVQARDINLIFIQLVLVKVFFCKYMEKFFI